MVEPAETPSDEQRLIEACRGGDARAWEEVVRLYGSYVRFIVRWERWGFPPSLHDDVYQESLVALHSAMKTFRGEASLKTLINRVTVKTCLGQRRRLYAERRTPFKEASEGFDGFIADPRPDPLEKLSEEDLRRALRNSLERLGEGCRDIIDLRFYQGLSYQEISKTRDTPIGTVGVRLGRCLDKLRDLLREERVL